MVNPIPEGLEGRIVPYLMIDGAAAAIDFYKAAFSATEDYRLEMLNGAIGHAQMKINGATVYLADAPDEMEGNASNPKKLGGTSVMLHQYVEDVDAVTAQAVAAGGTLEREPEDQFYGNRAALVIDPFGHYWSLHTQVKHISHDEMVTAMEDMTE